MALTYHNGQPVRIGDVVDLDGMPGRVIEIIETPEQQAQSGLSEPLVCFDTERYGELCQSPLDGGWDAVIPLDRHPA